MVTDHSVLNLDFYLALEGNEHSCPLTPDLRLFNDARGLIQLRNDVL